MDDADAVEQARASITPSQPQVGGVVVGHRDHVDAHGLHVARQRRLAVHLAVAIGLALEGRQVEDHALAVADRDVAIRTISSAFWNGVRMSAVGREFSRSPIATRRNGPLIVDGLAGVFR
jgi:hypothetical protein